MPKFRVYASIVRESEIDFEVEAEDLEDIRKRANAGEYDIDLCSDEYLDVLFVEEIKEPADAKV
jgi:hypothetical protein